MAQEKFLLTLEESSGGNDFMTRHVIEAENRQKVKYHYHRTLKDFGYHNSQFGKHCLRGPGEVYVEIYKITRLKPEEYEVLQKFLYSWTKV